MPRGRFARHPGDVMTKEKKSKLSRPQEGHPRPTDGDRLADLKVPNVRIEEWSQTHSFTCWGSGDLKNPVHECMVLNAQARPVVEHGRNKRMHNACLFLRSIRSRRLPPANQRPAGQARFSGLRPRLGSVCLLLANRRPSITKSKKTKRGRRVTPSGCSLLVPSLS